VRNGASLKPGAYTLTLKVVEQDRKYYAKTMSELTADPLPGKPSRLSYLQAGLRSRGALLMLVLVLSTLLLFARRPDVFLNPQIYAEDGVVFLTQQRAQGYTAIFVPYAGYYNLVPRLIAWLADQFPLYYTPVIYNSVAFLIFLLVILFIFLNSPGSDLQKSSFALAPVLLPYTGDLFVSVVNIQWVLAMMLPFLYTQLPLSNWRRTALSVFIILLVGLTGPFVVVSCPLLLYRLWQQKRPNIHEACFVAATVIAVVIQGACMFKEAPAAASATALWNDWLQAIFARFGAFLYFGRHLPEHLPVITAIASSVIIFSTLWAALFVRKEYRCRALIIFAYGLIIFGVVMKKFAATPLSLHPAVAGQRYYVLPYLSFFLFYLMLARESRNWLKWLGRTGLLLMLFSTASSFRIAPLPDFPWHENIKQLEVQEHVKFQISPGWDVELHRKSESR
jgi:hypothetical protein